jgi:hypothetical protein
MPSTAASPVSASLPNTPQLPKMGMPGRAAAAHPALATPREAVAARVVTG